MNENRDISMAKNLLGWTCTGDIGQFMRINREEREKDSAKTKQEAMAKDSK
jgi:hypothetical protein